MLDELHIVSYKKPLEEITLLGASCIDRGVRNRYSEWPLCKRNSEMRERRKFRPSKLNFMKFIKNELFFSGSFSLFSDGFRSSAGRRPTEISRPRSPVFVSDSSIFMSFKIETVEIFTVVSCPSHINL